MAETKKDLIFIPLKELKIKDYNTVVLIDKKGKKYAITILVGKSIKWLDKEYQLTIYACAPNKPAKLYFGAYDCKQDLMYGIPRAIQDISGQKLFRIDDTE